MSKKVKKNYYNNKEVVVAQVFEESDYALVYFKDDKKKSKFKVDLTELKETEND